MFCRDRGLREWQFYEWKKGLRPTEVAPFLAVRSWCGTATVTCCSTSVLKSECSSFPRVAPGSVELRAGELVMLLDGIDMEKL